MEPNPILLEIWRVKDELAREAGYDTHRFFENLRRWSQDHPHTGPVVRDAEEMRRLVAESKRQRAEGLALALKEPHHPKT
jgi:hypothetical protein